MKSSNIPVKFLKTVGKKRSCYLSKLGIYTVEDLLYYFPREIQDRRNLSFLSKDQELSVKEKVCVIGKIIAYDILQVKKKLGIFKTVIETGFKKYPLLSLVWFKKITHKYDVFSTLKKDIIKDKYIIAYGRVSDVKTRFLEINVEEYEVIDNLNQNSIHTNRLVPVYRLSESLSQQWFRQLIYDTINNYKLEEHLPQKILSIEKFVDINTAIKNIHFPDTWQLYHEAKKRLTFDKFLFIQIGVLKVKKDILSKAKVGKYEIKRFLLTPFKEKLKKLTADFDFTKAQKRVINELFKDMLSKKAMNRLLIGDVGSGKTIVSISCALLAVENGYQVAFMVPTEILAEQHYYNLLNYTQGLFNYHTNRNIKIELYIGKTLKKQKEKILSELQSGEIDILIGTHSLIEEKVKFKNLSLVIIDEQHRFGVIQRKKLYEKSVLPDILIMTATPIPRSLAMTLYGELDISVIDELPSGRKPVKTLFYDIDDYDYKLVLERLANNEKVYIVYPIIEETKLELKTLVDEYNKLSSTIFKDYPCGLLHGKMSYRQKEETMKKFREGIYKILFCTTVIEVGIDIPDATVIVINHAERFGLSQLHQLRGRVGRADKQSYCILLGKITTEEAKLRIESLLATNDGFKIANQDLLIRGPGQIFGTLQHGKTEIDFSEVLKYPELLNKAKEYAKKIVFLNEYKETKEIKILSDRFYNNIYNKSYDLSKVG
ncbi:MAG: ATP-dependent DNA helicase RecG [Endomicrobiia bacterium]